jgi:hypothetical protein
MANILQKGSKSSCTLSTPQLKTPFSALFSFSSVLARDTPAANGFFLILNRKKCRLRINLP